MKIILIEAETRVIKNDLVNAEVVNSNRLSTLGSKLVATLFFSKFYWHYPCHILTINHSLNDKSIHY